MMYDIKFARDYGYPPAAPFWLVWNERGYIPMFKHPTREDAEVEAARLATDSPGDSFHVLAVMATISTSRDVVGQRFDPTRVSPAPVAVEMEDVSTELAPEVSPTFEPDLLAGDDDGRPF